MLYEEKVIKNYVLYEGFYDGAFDAPMQTLKEVAQSFEGGDREWMWKHYKRGHVAGDAYRQLPTGHLRQLLWERIREYIWSRPEEDIEKILGGWRDFVMLGVTDQPGITDEERERAYLLEWLSQRTGVFYDDVDIFLDR